MRTDELKLLVGKVLCFDMLNRERPVSKLTEVTDDGYCVLDQPYVYVPVANNAGGFSVTAIPYAAPLFEVKILRVHCSHIVSIINVPKQMLDAYTRDTSGIMPVNSGLILPTKQ